MKKLLVNIINFYQIFSAILFVGVCKYEVSCSEFTKQAILKQGLLKGGIEGIKRILSCR